MKNIQLKSLLPLATLLLVAACSLPNAAPTLTQHDLGGMFPAGAARSPVALRNVQVVAQPLVASLDMQYREAAQPTRRGKYALNRWAASPASMVETGLVRQLAPDGNGRCRLQFSLAEFIIEVDASGKSRAVVAADAIVVRDAQTGVPAASLRQGFDVTVPMQETSPAAGAMALREAVTRLAKDSSAWLGGEPNRFCAG
ncbi:hypothetical protein VVD49_12175 [Uliginosibacterium sp. H3]|uniref:ABC-type transport auxiliary lipoprotein component domain-containing protein n=1 Tax=Uliginosibacterium silvisoli TaxID=3114758 RepID=A0ABU6K460_9RHOO|nr:hypothetical protein [Uliginosibacterium sp. H3]